jgi:hypothetical protein
MDRSAVVGCLSAHPQVLILPVLVLGMVLVFMLFSCVLGLSLRDSCLLIQLATAALYARCRAALTCSTMTKLLVWLGASCRLGH